MTIANHIDMNYIDFKGAIRDLQLKKIYKNIYSFCEIKTEPRLIVIPL